MLILAIKLKRPFFIKTRLKKLYFFNYSISLSYVYFISAANIKDVFAFQQK